jgi:hypothetical protein
MCLLRSDSGTSTKDGEAFQEITPAESRSVYLAPINIDGKRVLDIASYTGRTVNVEFRNTNTTRRAFLHSDCT